MPVPPIDQGFPHVSVGFILRLLAGQLFFIQVKAQLGIHLLQRFTSSNSQQQLLQALCLSQHSGWVLHRSSLHIAFSNGEMIHPSPQKRKF
jgi:hypothetical protein